MFAGKNKSKKPRKNGGPAQESAKLLPLTIGSESHGAIKNDSAATEEHGHHGGKKQLHAKVSPLELFSDLVMVVAIHAVSDLLLEDEEGAEDTHSEHHEEVDTDFKLPKYFFRVFLLWHIWHNAMIVTNAGNLFTNNHMGLYLHLFIFSIMFLILGIAKACDVGNDVAAVGLYLLGRIGELIAFLQVTQRPKPPGMEEERYLNFQEIAKIPPKAFVGEGIPLLFAIFNAGHGGEFGIISMEWVYTCFFFVFTIRYLGVYVYEQKNKDAVNHMFGLHHLQERYELITLIFLGEICFAVTSDPGQKYASFCCFLTAIGCYILCFAIKYRDRLEGFERSGMYGFHAQHLHLGMFCSIPGIGVGFVKAIGFFSEENADNNPSQDPLIFDEPEEFADARTAIKIICYSVAVFMTCSSLFSFIAKEHPIDMMKPKIPAWTRNLYQLIAGGVIALVPSGASGGVFDNVTFTITFVPLLMILVGFFQLRGMRLVSTST